MLDNLFSTLTFPTASLIGMRKEKCCKILTACLLNPLFFKCGSGIVFHSCVSIAYYFLSGRDSARGSWIEETLVAGYVCSVCWAEDS